MPETRHRVVIDTNLWISFLLTRNFSALDKRMLDGTLVLLFSRQLLEECIGVARRPKFRKYFSPSDIGRLFSHIRPYAEWVTTSSRTDACRDPKDNFLLDLAADGNATHLITGDSDLLVLERHGATTILTMGEYLALPCRD